MAALSVAEIAELVDGTVSGDGARRIHGAAPLEDAGADHLSFVANPRYFAYIATTRAGVVLVPREAQVDLPEGLTAVRVADPHAALAALLPVLYPQPERLSGVHPTAVVSEGAEVAADAYVGAFAFIGAETRVESGASVGMYVSVGARCSIGESTVLHPHVTLYDGVSVGARCTIHSGARLGADGFGFTFVDGAHRKVPQVGGCRIEDDVEIGANSTVDRGSIGDTVVGQGTKIDNLVHIGHNCRIGRHVIVIAQVGISGSTRVGDGAVLAGQVGVGGHLSIGAGARVGAQAGVTADVPAGATVSGYPARPHAEALRAQAAVFKLPALLKRIRALEALLSRDTKS